MHSSVCSFAFKGHQHKWVMINLMGHCSVCSVKGYTAGCNLIVLDVNNHMFLACSKLCDEFCVVLAIIQVMDW